MDCEDLWIFGYGSLIWRPGFTYLEKRPARLYAYARRFWQGSTDHRGVPGAPGRVVTLESESNSCCDGIAYRVCSEESQSIIAGLDHRERGGYERVWVDLEFRDSSDSRARAIVYRARPENDNYLGPASDLEIAKQILNAQGPSGSNVEYVFKLAAAIRLQGGEDDHVFALEGILLSHTHDTIP